MLLKIIKECQLLVRLHGKLRTMGKRVKELNEENKISISAWFIQLSGFNLHDTVYLF